MKTVLQFYKSFFNDLLHEIDDDYSYRKYTYLYKNIWFTSYDRRGFFHKVRLKMKIGYFTNVIINFRYDDKNNSYKVSDWKLNYKLNKVLYLKKFIKFLKKTYITYYTKKEMDILKLKHDDYETDIFLQENNLL